MAEVADAPRRAKSPSPPPAGGDRKRGRSSPVLPPPPPGPPPPEQHNKRYRREGGGFDRRRLGGGGGGGFEHDDRRDHGGMGRRGDDDRGHGRYMNRAPDWSDSGRGGWNEGPGNRRYAYKEGFGAKKNIKVPTLSSNPALVVQLPELEDDISPVEAQSRYEEYKSEYIRTQKKAYFDLHKNEDWLKNKYHPTNLESVIERRNELARTTANEFFLDLQNGSLDTGPGLTGSVVSKSGNNSSVTANDLVLRLVEFELTLNRLKLSFGIENNVLSATDNDKSEPPIVIIRGSSTVKGLEGVELLDTLVTYLWRIHGVDYYGMSETNEPKGLRHVRADARTYNGASSNATEWENKLDSFWRDRIEGQDPQRRRLMQLLLDVLDPYVRKIRDEKYGWKYGCGAKGCTKLFHAPEFVQKHLKLKHTDVVVELTSKVREDVYFENYMNDPKAPGGTPIMQQSAPRGKGRQRPPIESRLRDERGRRFDRNADSPPHDGPGENPDDPIFDSYGDPMMHGAFPPDIPAPPVLMPVPGAGPLGPFIPAPPEVAMRMMRDQGGPPPFEPPVAPHPRKAGRGGIPPMGGPSPIFTAPPVPHDPRRIRSYQDLDAPEDEVTVMDYRSL
ncbi:hypothetical protein EJB05_48194 [Eragrostis curvula]|uniref:C2H2-type domain-containing protein n=1 Tax=Eragrostis curvula TaxID=38414 RepID=A0A5J9T119_9POAL|nr:hypothetical protein EJB05_48194 [Eragrostis curvula]